jgi:hypothetical protein
MKLSYYSLLIIFITISCKETKKKIEIKKEVSIENKKNIEIPICKDLKRDINLYKEFIGEENISYRNSIKKTNLYQSVKKKYFNAIFNSDDISCIVPLSGSVYNIFDIYYDNDSAEKIYNNIIKINKSKDSSYHDFFKRGIVFILNKRKNKITILTFNPFSDNSLPKKIKLYFYRTKTQYDKVIMTTGVGAIEILKE